MKITILSIGKFDKSLYRELFEYYLKRLKWKIEINSNGENANFDPIKIFEKITDTERDIDINLFENYTVFNSDNNYLTNSNINEKIDSSYNNYKLNIHGYQPLVILDDIYNIDQYNKYIEKTEENKELQFFIKKSFENMKLIDHDFIEIGTSNFNTLIEFKLRKINYNE